MKAKRPRKFAGRGMHIEFHNIDPKKTKAADCIYLTETRICHNKKAPHYLAKCFAATYCTYKVKEKDAVKIKEPDKKTVLPAPKPVAVPTTKQMQCSLPLGCKMTNAKYGEGKYVGYNPATQIIEVAFPDKVHKFFYPKAFFDKFLIVTEELYEIVKKDLRICHRFRIGQANSALFHEPSFSLLLSSLFQYITD